MSRENVEVVRRTMEAFAEGDEQAFLEGFDSDVVIQQTAPIPDARSYEGHEGVVQALADWNEVFGDLVMSAEELTDCENENVLVRIHQTARGAGSGVPVEFDTWFVYRVSGGKVSRLEMFNEREQALEAVGLRE
jgi:ketosteroid isomerase-like protein